VKVTVLLMSVDEAPMLARSLPAVLAQEPTPEVIVVDNASTDDTAQLAQRHGAGYLRLDARLSYAAALNAAIAASEGEAVLLLNADCLLRPGFLAAAARRLDDARVGSVAPKLVRLQAPEEIDAAGMFLTRWRRNGLVGFGTPSTGFSTPGEAFGADGAAALYRRRTLEECALNGHEVFDQDMALWASDVDLAWRAQLLGWRCAYEPRAVADHVRSYSPATRRRMSRQARRLQFRNRYLMIAKNETAAGLRRHGLLLAAYELLVLGHVLLREPHLLTGYHEAWRLRSGVRRRRRLIQARRRVDLPPFGLRPAR
jgi:GT2 family glycosyltransferase